MFTAPLLYNDFANNQDAKKDKATRLNELAKKKMFLTFSVDFSIPIIVYNFDSNCLYKSDLRNCLNKLF